MKEMLRNIIEVKRALRAWREEFSSGDEYKKTVINSLIRKLELAAVAGRSLRLTTPDEEEDIE